MEQNPEFGSSQLDQSTEQPVIVERADPMFVNVVHQATHPLRWAILEKLTLGNAVLGASDLQIVTGLAPSTFFKVMSELTDSGLVDQLGRGQYHISTQGAELVMSIGELTEKHRMNTFTREFRKHGLEGRVLEEALEALSNVLRRKDRGEFDASP